MKHARTFTSIAFILALGACASTPAVPVYPVQPTAETDPMPSVEDAADDPAIWVGAARTLVLGTDKQTGLYVFDLAGRQVQALPIGMLNNVDLRKGGIVDYAVASNDGLNEVSVFTIDKDTGAVSYVGGFPTGELEPYGICLGKTDTTLLPVVTYKTGLVQIFELDPLAADDAITAREIARPRLSSQLEGCVVDEVNNTLFVGEEGKGVWALDLGNIDAGFTAVDMIANRNGLAADVEGVSLWRGAEGKGWLVVSAQGRSRYVVYDRQAPYQQRGVFEITDLTDASGRIIVDRTSVTDGIDVVSDVVSADYPRGLLVVQDDVNSDPAANQNFKYVSWAEVERALSLPVLAPE